MNARRVSMIGLVLLVAAVGPQAQVGSPFPTPPRNGAIAWIPLKIALLNPSAPPSVTPSGRSFVGTMGVRNGVPVTAALHLTSLIPHDRTGLVPQPALGQSQIFGVAGASASYEELLISEVSMPAPCKGGAGLHPHSEGPTAVTPLLWHGLSIVRFADGHWIPRKKTEPFKIGSDEYVDEDSVRSSSASENGMLVSTDTQTITFKRWRVGRWETGRFRAKTTFKTDLQSGRYQTTIEQRTDYDDPRCVGADNSWSTPVSHSLRGAGAGKLSLMMFPAPADRASLTARNPFRPSGGGYLASPPSIDQRSIPLAPVARGVAADGHSAVVLMFRSDSDKTVSFSLSAPFGSLSEFTSDYLSNPTPVRRAGPLDVTERTCDSNGTCTFLALFWAPDKMPPTTFRAGRYAPVQVTVSATQGTSAPENANIEVVPPPVVLIHGIWSSRDAWAPFHRALSGQYPHDFIVNADYSRTSMRSYTDPANQGELEDQIEQALSSANTQGTAARQVDIVAHSMGGLIARQFVSASLDTKLPNPVHLLVTVGTPHRGSPLAVELDKNKAAVVQSAIVPWKIKLICRLLKSCTLGGVLGFAGREVDSGVKDLRSPLTLTGGGPYRAIVGTTPTQSMTWTESWLNEAFTAFMPSKTIKSMLGEPGFHDTIVPRDSQIGDSSHVSFVPGLVHAKWPLTSDTEETSSQEVWHQIIAWLMGRELGEGLTDEGSSQPATVSASVTSPLDLTGYTEISPSNISVLPVTGSTLTTHETTNITATSSTKAIVQLLLIQKMEVPSDAPERYAFNAPFAIPFTPTRLGAADFIVVAAFNDQTYATSELHYTLLPNGPALALRLTKTLPAALTVGEPAGVRVEAVFPTGVLDVTDAATYGARSGASSVFSAGPVGTITATGRGMDWLEVSHGGLKTSTAVAVGNCEYAITPKDQAVPMSGGSITLQLTTSPDCSWTASTPETWLSPSAATGKGSAALTFTAAPITSNTTRIATASVANQTAFVTQLGKVCAYTVGQTQVAVAAAGGSGTFAVTTTCDVIVPAPAATWVSAFASEGSVIYFVEPNPTAAARTTTIGVGAASVAITQQPTTVEVPVVTTVPVNQTVAVGGKATFNLVASGVPTPTYQWQVSTDAGSTWASLADTAPYSGATSSALTVTSAAATFNGYRYRALATNTAGTATSSAATLTVTTATTGTVSATPAALQFGGAASGGAIQTVTPAQSVAVTFSGAAMTWTAASNQPWLTITGGSGTSAGAFTAQVVKSLVPSGATGLSATITITATGASNSPLTLPVTLTVTTAAATAAPIGYLDTPAAGASVSGSISVSGWALDDTGVDRVEIWRDKVPGETTPAYPGPGLGTGKIYIANAFFVSGARPDIMVAHPTWPQVDRAGWGYLLLTQGLWNQGNGQYTLHAFAYDQDGRGATLGSKTISVNNATAVKPFGSIDTPLYGERVTTGFWNFGWALTPNATPTCLITDGNVKVSIDSQPLVPVTYGGARTDIASAFPGLSNGSAAGGAYFIDTTALANGTHQIGWYVTDSCGRAEGIGSRFFSVLNGGSNVQVPNAPGRVEPESAARVDSAAVEVVRGHEVTVVTPSPTGAHVVPIRQGERVEVRLPSLNGAYAGYQIVNQQRLPSPLGSTFDSAQGIFYWEPGAGFLGAYDLEFVPASGGAAVRVRAVAATSVQAVIDTPQPGLVDSSFVIAGWAIDEAATTGTGIDVVHGWAYPVSGGEPTFLGVAAYGDLRPDIGALFGDQFGGASYSLVVDSLAAGEYDIVVYPHSAVVGDFHGAKVVRVTVR